MELLLSEEARRIISTPFPEKRRLIWSASEQVKAELAIEMQRQLNERFPEKRALTDAVTSLVLEDPPVAPI